MKRALAMLACGVAVAAGVGGCAPGSSSSAVRELQANQELWAAQGLVNYQYTLAASCFCPVELLGPAVVTVRNNQVVSVVSAETGQPITDPTVLNPQTIDQWFAYIRSALLTADRVEVGYDAAMGYPTQITIDQIELAVDDELYYTISNVVAN